MKYATFLMCVLLLFSCDSLLTRSMQKRDGVGIAIQSFAAACCGGCGQSVLVDSLNGVQHALHVECDVEKSCCRLCGFSTEKLLYKYSGKSVLQQSRFKPVYDTLKMKMKFPLISRSGYFDPVQLRNPVIPLNRTDSMLISLAMNDSRTSNCDKTYLSLIVGFVFVNTEPVKFKNPVRFK